MDRATMSAYLAGLTTACLATVAVYRWDVREPARGHAMSVPGMDDPYGWKERDRKEAAERVIHFGSIHEVSGAAVPDISGAWPQFRGPAFAITAEDRPPLAELFPPEGPPLLWQKDVCQGYAGPSVLDGRVFLMDHIESVGDVLRCLSLSDGEEIWRCGYRIHIPSNHGITRTVPAVTPDYVLGLGAMGHVMCVDTETGRSRWGLDLMKAYGTRDLTKMWYAGQCPLIDAGAAIIAPAGSNVLMMAVSCETGDILWTTPNRKGWRMSHSSITPMTVDRTRMYVYAACEGVAAVRADGPEAGTLLWDTEAWSSSVVMPSPVVLPGNRVFVTSGYDGGSALLQVVHEDGAFGVQTVYSFSGSRLSRDCFSCYQQTPIYYAGHLFGIQSNEAKQHRMRFCCVDPREPGGRIIWSSTEDTVFTAPKKREAWGPYVLADKKFYVLGDTGNLAVFEASTSHCEKIGEWRLIENGHECWGPMAVAAGRLLVRDVDRLFCFDLRAQPQGRNL